MFKVKAPEAIKASLTIVGHGREQKLNLTYRHMTQEAYSAVLGRLAGQEITSTQAILDMVIEWDADVDLDTAGVDEALQQQIGLDAVIITGYAQAIQVARKGN